MKRAMIIMLVCVLGFFSLLFGFKAVMIMGQKNFVRQFKNPVITITAIQAKKSTWNSSLSVVGSTRTVKGVDITTEAAGLIKEINFTPGSNVKKDTILVKLNVAPDIAKLHQLQAEAKLALITEERDKKQFSFGAVSKAQLDTDEANQLSTAAAVEQEKATIDQKIIRAPFTGKLGISAVNPGEYITTGQKIVSLQTIDPIYVDFYLPQQQVSDAVLGETVQVTTDRAKEKIFTGKITTINPEVNADVRNIEVEATLPNPDGILLPGMFTNVVLNVGSNQEYITLPQMAVTFNPYGSIVYLLEKTTQKYQDKTVWKAQQEFVTTGITRGNQIAILKGIKVGDMVVTSGQLKLKNGSLVIIDNKVAPSDNPNPPVLQE